jgi:dGTPase
MAMYSAADRCRIDGRPGREPGGHRTDFRRDYARLIHAPAFRRLQNKTQLFPGLESDFFRNRLTHSIEVAQIAGGIAQTLNSKEATLQAMDNQLDIDLVQFAAAAHDLGHPPFGHNGEKALDDAMKKFGGFEGNAQTLRILTRLEKRVRANDFDHPNSSKHADAHGRLGLNLTMRSVAAVLKYDAQIRPVRSDQDSLEKGFYDSESVLVSSVKTAVAPTWPSGQKFKTIECQIMDVADDIAYCTYDLEDTLKGGFLSPTQMIREVDGSPPVLVDEINEKVQKALADDGADTSKRVTKTEITNLLIDWFFDKETLDTATFLDNFAIDRSFVEDGYVRTEFTSWFVEQLMDRLEFTFDPQHPAMSTIKLCAAVRREVEILKHLNYQLTIRSPRLAVVQYQGYDLVRKVFEALVSDKGRDLLPMDVRTLHDKCRTLHEQRRVVCDFIAGMTDRYAVEFYSRLNSDDQSIFKPF